MTTPSSALFRASRPAFRSQFFTPALRRSAGRRWQSSDAGTGTGGAGGTGTGSAPPNQSWFQKMWDSPIGVKTVHFWAPVMKWGLVLAGVSDFARPASSLSLTQNGALTATGIIWTRWCLIIKPKNYLLAAVNFFLGLVGVVQVSRIMMWRSSQKELEAQAKGEVADAKEAVKAVVKA
ncbi:upf0041 domain protein [Podospora conica]|nr:upf0041 domain protein [Schizothecium conicum]